MKKAKILAKILSLSVMGCVLFTSNVYAVETKTTIDNVGNNKVIIMGTVEPTIVSADVTLTGAFAIKPNESDPTKRFISSTVKVRNTSVVPLKISAVSLKHVGESPSVVSNTKFTEEQWKGIGIADTQSNIALGLIGDDIQSFWFVDETNQAPQNLAQIKAGQEMNMSLQAKHGLSWTKGKQIDYELVFELEMIQ